MRKINIILTTLILLAIMPMVLGASSMSVPVDSGNYTSPMTVTVIYDGHNPQNMTNLTCYTNITGGTANTFGVTVVNTTSTQTTFTGTITLATDALDIYNITCLLQNCTATDCSTNASFYAANITIDSTDPVCDLTKKHSKPAYKGIQELTWSSSDALSLISTAVIIDRPQEGDDLTYTDTSRTLTLSSQDTKWLGDWTTTLIATDRSGNTATCTETWSTYLPNGAIEDAREEESKTDIKGLAIVILLVGGLYLIFKDR